MGGIALAVARGQRHGDAFDADGGIRRRPSPATLGSAAIGLRFDGSDLAATGPQHGPLIEQDLAARHWHAPAARPHRPGTCRRRCRRGYRRRRQPRRLALHRRADHHRAAQVWSDALQALARRLVGMPIVLVMKDVDAGEARSGLVQRDQDIVAPALRPDPFLVKAGLIELGSRNEAICRCALRRRRASDRQRPSDRGDVLIEIRLRRNEGRCRPDSGCCRSCEPHRARTALHPGRRRTGPSAPAHAATAPGRAPRRRCRR